MFKDLKNMNVIQKEMENTYTYTCTSMYFKRSK